MRRAILLLGLLCAGLFAGALLVSFTHPLLVETALWRVLSAEVEREVASKFDGSRDTSPAALARHARSLADPEYRYIQDAIRRELPGHVARVVAKMLDPDCPCRQRAASAASADAGGLGTWRQHGGLLSEYIERAYGVVSRKLLREFRIFTASNAIAFALLALVARVRRRAGAQLLLPAIALVGAVAITGGLYLFNQDWLHTVVFGDYVGYGYAAWLSVVALLLGDFLMNRARVSTNLVNAFGAAATPC